MTDKNNEHLIDKYSLRIEQNAYRSQCLCLIVMLYFFSLSMSVTDYQILIVHQ